MAFKELLSRRIYTHNGISVVVEIDFSKKKVSFVESTGGRKDWVFYNRGPEYLDGWVRIMEAMAFATKEARSALAAVTEEEHEQFIKMMMEIDNQLKGNK